MKIQGPCFDLSTAELKKANLERPIFTSSADFENALKQLGFFPGMKVVVHTRFSSLGRFENGPENFCAILKRMISEDGLLMMPGLVSYPGDGEAFTYDPETTPVNVGIVAETFRKQPGVLRSWDPTHSFCVWGKDKEFYIRNHHKLHAMHRDSPLGLLEQTGGYCMLIGCLGSVTFMHVVETANQAHCLGTRTEEYPAVIHGKLVKLRGWGWRNGNCRAWNVNSVYKFMREHGTVSEKMLGRSHLVLFRLKDFRTAYETFLHDPAIGCTSCDIKPRCVKQSVPSDWDAARDQLRKTDAFLGDYAIETTTAR